MVWTKAAGPSGPTSALASRATADPDSGPLSPHELALTIAFGGFASLTSLITIYIAYRQLCATRCRRRNGTSDPEDVAMAVLPA